MCATVGSGVDASPVLEFAEHVFDSVALFVEDGVVGDRGSAVRFGGDAGGDFAVRERLTEPIGVIVPIPMKPPVCNGMIAPRDSWMMPPPCNEMIPPGAPRLLA